MSCDVPSGARLRSRVVLGLSALAAALAIAAGCSDLCARSSDCATGLVCTVDGTCIVPPDASGDGGGTTVTVDAATTDADVVDASVIDAELDARVGT